MFRWFEIEIKKKKKKKKKKMGRGRGRGMGVCDFCDDYDYGIKQVAGNDGYDYGITQAGNDDYDYDEGRYLFFRLVAQGRKTS